MLSITGYIINEKIYESTRSSVYRGTRDSDKLPVILKALNREYPSPQEIARFRREYEITRNLDVKDAIGVHALEHYKNSLMIVLEDFGGQSLASILPLRKFEIAEFLNLAIKTTIILGRIHQNNIIHKDVNPSNIIWNPDTDELKIIDFGIASPFLYEQPETPNLHVFEGTPAYLSPEQTGRMNRMVDYRSDFYSLGITFYEMLLGFLPFQTTDTMELVHCHLAKTPPAPHTVNQQVPKPVSDVVMKLIAKSAEERYQSAAGLLSDLQKCLEQLQFSGHIRYVAIGQNDVPKTLQIPQKLYGRTQEIDVLLSAFARISQGKSEIILISGHAGVGKSALVHEIHKPVIEHHGYFVSGRFNGYQKTVPYSAVFQALRRLIQQIITENEARLSLWKELLYASIGEELHTLAACIPELHVLLDSSPERAATPPPEPTVRLQLLLQKFIHIFCSRDHPLVLFLDNLQWADTVTLKLLQHVFETPDNQSMLIIGAYRDHEITPEHPLQSFLNALQAGKTACTCISLSPLRLTHLNQLLADMLQYDKNKLLPLAEILLEKTGGNPYATKEFLKAMGTENVLTFDSSNKCWQWNLEQIQGMAMTENAAEFMVSKIRKLPLELQRTLQLAACVGNRFNLHALASVTEKTEAVIAAEMDMAIDEGIVLPADESYRYINFFHATELKEFAHHVSYDFVHSRFQETALQLIPETELGSFHLKIGRYLLHNEIPQKIQDEHIIAIVDHFNQGDEFITSTDERRELIRLNLLAGKHTKVLGDYNVAFHYISKAIFLLENEHWQARYALAFDVYAEQAELAYLCGDFEQAEHLLTFLLQQSQTITDKAAVLNLFVRKYTLQTDYAKAIQTGRQALQMLGIELPQEKELPEQLKRDLAEIAQHLHEKEIASIIYEPLMTDESKKRTLQVLNSLVTPTLQTQYSLYAFVITCIVKISLRYGHAPESAFGYSRYGALIGALKGQYAKGYEFGLLAVKLSKQFGNSAQLCKTMFSLAADLACWVKPIKSIHALEQEAYHTALDAGELQFASLTLVQRMLHMLYEGGSLEQLLADSAEYLDFVKNSHDQAAIDVMTGCQLIIHNLRGLTSEKLSFTSPILHETAYLNDCQEHHNIIARCVYQILKSQVFYLYGEPEKALHQIHEVEPFIEVISSFIIRADFTLYHSLTLSALYPESSQEQQQRFWRQLEQNQRQMSVWASHCPENFHHCDLLMQAELARLSEKPFLAMQHYQQATETAREHRFVHHAALAHEAAVRFYMSSGFRQFAEFHLKEAHYCYNLWGATRKIEDLEKRYPQLMENVIAQAQEKNLALRSTSVVLKMGENGLSILDLNTVMKASQTISENIVLEELLQQMMRIVIENAGAQKGWLIRENDGMWVIDAEGRIDSDVVKVLQAIPLHFGGTTHRPPLPISILQYIIHTKNPLVLHHASQEGQFTHDPHIRRHHVKSVLCTPLLKQGVLKGIIYLENNSIAGAFTPDRLKVLNLLSAQMIISIENATLYKQLHKSLDQQIELSNQQVELTNAYNRFVPKEFLGLLGKKSIVDVQLGEQIEKEITVMFSDIRGFTPLSEQMTPQENFNFINSYLSQMSPIIRKHHGFIDKYIGDAIMALFSTHADDAVQCSIAMLQKLNEYNEGRKRAGYRPIQIGIGLNTGLLMLGTVGDQDRMDGTVISDAVNLAARIEGMTKTYGVSLLISETTYFQLTNSSDYSIRIIDQVQAKGKSEPVTVFEVFDADPPRVIESKLKTLVLFKQGFKLYHRIKFAEAQSLFNDVLEVNPEDQMQHIAEAKALFQEILHVNSHDKVAQIYYQRCEQIEKFGVPKEWAGVWDWVNTMKKK